MARVVFLQKDVHECFIVVAELENAPVAVAEIPINYVFSNSSFNNNDLKQAIKFGMHLILTKGGSSV